MNEFEYIKEFRPGRSWLTLAVFALIIICSGLLMHHMVCTCQPEWDFGALPATPGESVYSTRPVARTVPQQIAVLPDAATGTVNQVGSAAPDRLERTP